MSEEVPLNKLKTTDNVTVVAESIIDELRFNEINYNLLCKETDNDLGELFNNDYYLNDLPYDITLDEVLAQIAVVKGQSITIYISRESLPSFKIVIPESNSTVLDLKKAIKRNYEVEQKRYLNRKKITNQVNFNNKNKESSEEINKNTLNDLTTKISWRYIWKIYDLELNNEFLVDDNQLLSYYGVCNKSVLKFVKKIKHKRYKK